MDIEITARLTNWDQYQRGERRDISIAFPTTRKEVQKALKAIGVDGIRDRRVILTEHDSNLHPNFCCCLSQYDSVDEVNYLACLLSGLTESELETFQAVLEYGEHDQCAGDLIDLVLNLDCYELHPGVDTDEELGRIYADFNEAIEVPEELKKYFDYEAYGRDVRLNENGCFVEGGYLTRNSSGFVPQYAGPEEIPPEHRVFAYPKLNIRERLAACKEVADRAVSHETAVPSKDRDER